MNASKEIRAGDRFAFGENWARFLALVDDDRISLAERSLTARLGTIAGRTFVDVGCGSGLFSLAARNLGAHVVSFDYDDASVRCAQELRRRYRPDDIDWAITQGSALDEAFLATLGVFDIVYSWGVLHHTGDLWMALERVHALVAPGGRLFVSIYNDQGLASRNWTRVKWHYNAAGPMKRRFILEVVRLRFTGQEVFWKYYFRLRGFDRLDAGSGRERGMDSSRDLLDWVGGWPFEVAKPEDIFVFYRDRGYRLDYLKTCGPGHGCNEFVFDRGA